MEDENTNNVLDAAGFDRWALTYDASVADSEAADEYPFAAYSEVLAEVYRQVVATGGKSVLDLGFGTATFTELLYKAGYQISGVDFSVEMLRRAKEKMPTADLYQADFSKGLPEPIKGRRFSAIIFTYSIHHLSGEKQVQLLSDLAELLEPGGKIIIGDVAAETRADLDRARQKDLQLWDDDEYYPVAADLRRQLPQLTVTFMKKSYCSGLILLEHNF